MPNKDNKICFVGDLIDKGNSSQEVVEFVKSNNYDCILGNHEKYMIDTMPLILEDRTNLNHKWLVKLSSFIFRV